MLVLCSRMSFRRYVRPGCSSLTVLLFDVRWMNSDGLHFGSTRLKKKKVARANFTKRVSVKANHSLSRDCRTFVLTISASFEGSKVGSSFFQWARRYKCWNQTNEITADIPLSSHVIFSAHGKRTIDVLRAVSCTTRLWLSRCLLAGVAGVRA